jgi:hypothetical protein
VKPGPSEATARVRAAVLEGRTTLAVQIRDWGKPATTVKRTITLSR